MLTVIVEWLIVGLLAGFIASKLINRRGDGVIMDLVLGVIGAVIGGFISTRVLHGPPVSGLNLTSLVIAAVGAVIVLLAYHRLIRRRPQSLGAFLRRQLRR
ncbi:MAG: GlsB/YeaQ/YmgE family stress response membrane protein [Caulobacteraceae bacterium]